MTHFSKQKKGKIEDRISNHIKTIILYFTKNVNGT